jgi:hypothetical protein
MELETLLLSLGFTVGIIGLFNSVIFVLQVYLNSEIDRIIQKYSRETINIEETKFIDALVATKSGLETVKTPARLIEILSEIIKHEKELDEVRSNPRENRIIK